MGRLTKDERDALRERIVWLYDNRSKRDDHFDVKGALSWYAFKVGLTAKTVIRWVNGERSPDSPVFVLLGYQEAETRHRIGRRKGG